MLVVAHAEAAPDAEAVAHAEAAPDADVAPDAEAAPIPMPRPMQGSQKMVTIPP